MTPKSHILSMKSRTEVDPTTLDRPTSPRESGTFFRKCGGVRVLGTPTSKCSDFATTGPYSYRFHTRDNDDLYLTNLSQILKIHVDFRVIAEPAGWRHPIYQKVRNWFRSANKPLSSAKTFKNQQNKSISKIDFRLLC